MAATEANGFHWKGMITTKRNNLHKKEQFSSKAMITQKEIIFTENYGPHQKECLPLKGMISTKTIDFP